MEHPIDLGHPAKLILAESVLPFGDGYRQVTGRTLATGTVTELLRRASEMPAHQRKSLFISSEKGGDPLTLDEVERQMSAGDH